MSASSKSTIHQHLGADAPMVGDGGRVTLAKGIRTRAGWPAERRLEIVVELIAPGWVELHLETHVTERLQRARSLPDRDDGDKRQKARLRQGVDDIWTPLTYNPSDSRIELPANVLAYLGIHPQPHQARSAVTNEEKTRGPRYGGQQVYAQAGEGYITLMSLARATQRAEEMLERLKDDAEG